MRTEKQSEASRNNGKKSQGPVTGQGKANSAKNASTHNLSGNHFILLSNAQNATTHNLSGNHFILLSNEKPEEFTTHQHEYVMRFQPIDGVEFDLVQQMIIASWRQRRISRMESALFEIEMARHAAEVDREFLQIDPPGRQVLALFGTTEAAAASSLLLRYAGSARRDYTTALRTLRDLQGDRFNRNSRSAVQSASPTRSAIPPPAPEPPQESVPDTEAVDSSALMQTMQSSTRPSVTVLRRPDAHAGENSEMQNEPEHAATFEAMPFRNHGALARAAA
jgi:hypothetical protein